jgi:hypothetical protein
MRAQTVRFLASAFLSGAGLFFASSPNTAAAENDATVMQVDHAFVQAAAKGDAAAVGKMVDAEFTWTDAEGKTLTAEEVLRAVPKDPLGDESGS